MGISICGNLCLFETHKVSGTVTCMLYVYKEFFRSVSGVAITFLACGARGPRFEAQSSSYELIDNLKVSPASKSWYDWNTVEAT